jgi:hypothetical protein
VSKAKYFRRYLDKVKLEYRTHREFLHDLCLKLTLKKSETDDEELLCLTFLGVTDLKIEMSNGLTLLELSVYDIRDHQLEYLNYSVHTEQSSNSISFLCRDYIEEYEK